MKRKISLTNLSKNELQKSELSNLKGGVNASRFLGGVTTQRPFDPPLLGLMAPVHPPLAPPIHPTGLVAPGFPFDK